MSRRLAPVATLVPPRQRRRTPHADARAVTLTLLAVPGTALAAPPANDNRADAEAIPAFPHTVSATTAEATVERLDPQVSRCGRIESTLWYRVDTAPDGLIGSPSRARQVSRRC